MTIETTSDWLEKMSNTIKSGNKREFYRLLKEGEWITGKHVVQMLKRKWFKSFSEVNNFIQVNNLKIDEITLGSCVAQWFFNSFEEVTTQAQVNNLKINEWMKKFLELQYLFLNGDSWFMKLFAQLSNVHNNLPYKQYILLLGCSQIWSNSQLYPTIYDQIRLPNKKQIMDKMVWRKVDILKVLQKEMSYERYGGWRIYDQYRVPINYQAQRWLVSFYQKNNSH